MSKPTYKLTVKCSNPASYSLTSVVSEPRSTTQIDVTAACRNLELELTDPVPPASVEAVVRYVLVDFFAMAHRTGLYNRQKLLWESISRVSQVEVFRLTQGLFSKQDLPYFDVHFNDAKGRLLIYAHIVENGDAGDQNDDSERKQKDLLRTVHFKAEKLKGSKGQLYGVFLVYPKPFPEIIVKTVEKLTGASDPVGKFESLLPEPMLIPINLLESSQVATNNGELIEFIDLVHPDLGAKGRTKIPAPVKKIAAPRSMPLATEE